jgi:hypothetical protein
MLMTKHSPLTRIFRLGLNRIRDSGVLQQTYSKWVGSNEDLKTEDPFSTVRLGPGQVFTSFLLMMISIFVCAVILTLELIYSHTVKIVQTRKQSK